MLTASRYDETSWKETFSENGDKFTLLDLVDESDPWKTFLKECFKDGEEEEILNKILKREKGIDIYPSPFYLFHAFNSTTFGKIRVVIIGQDPYATRDRSTDVPLAMGMSFSVASGIRIPPSLENIFDNLIRNGHLRNISKEKQKGNLEFWAAQGVLLINTALTVEANKPNSHAELWREFSLKLIEKLSDHFDHLVFLLWGSESIKLARKICNKKHEIVASSHPSSMGNAYKTPLVAKGYPSFYETDHFGRTNRHLLQFHLMKGETKEDFLPICWSIW